VAVAAPVRGERELGRRRIDLNDHEREDGGGAWDQRISIPASIWQRQEGDWRLVGYNDAALAATGGRLAEFKGSSASEFYHDRPDIQEDMAHCFAEQTSFKREMLYGFRSTGEDRHLALSYVFAPPDQILLLAEDITDKVQAEEALQAAREMAEAASVEEHVRRQEAERRGLIAATLRDILAALNSNLLLDAVLDLIAARAQQLLDAQAVGIYRLESEADRWAVEAARGLLVTYVAGSNVPIGQNTLRQAILSRQPLIGSPASDSGSHGKDRQPASRLRFGWYRAWLAVPIITRDEIYGGMLLYYSEPRALSEEEIQLAAAFCDQATLAIENARLREWVQQAAAAAERERLARDLHDAVTQTLFSASVIAETMPRIWKTRPQEAEDGIEELRRLTRGALAEMRTLLLELRPAGLTEKPLGELLNHLADAVTGRTRMPVALTVQGDTMLPPDLQIALYRIAQEALNNISKHARASQAWVSLDYGPGGGELQVRDDGRGFDPGTAVATPTSYPEEQPARPGLGTMRERATSIGADLKIESKAGQGTRIRVTWQSATER
jgi:signal transduction histidine kinase